MNQITHNDIDSLAIGSTILGSGGGGDPGNELLMAKHALEKNGPVKLIGVEELNSEDLIVPVAFMGAPLISLEKLSNGKEFDALLKLIEKTFGKKPDALLPAEIGGSNALTPFLIAGKHQLPVVDADTIGRAFPELQMSSCNLKGVSPSPSFIGDSQGNAVMINGKDAHALENLARHVTVGMGSSAAIAIYLMSGAQTKTSVEPGTINRAIKIGKAIQEARKSSTDPIQALLKATNGKLIGRGTIVDVDQQVVGGFLNGTTSISDGNQSVKVLYQNEYLLAKSEENVLATTPDILALLDTETGEAITSESLRYGLRVALVSLPAPSIWTTLEGLDLVGPRCFGFEIDYKKG